MTDDRHATLWNILPALLLAGLVLLQGGGLDKPLSLAVGAVFLLTALRKTAAADLSRRLSPTVLAVGGYFLLSMAAGLYAKWGWLAVGEAAKYLTAFCVFGTLTLWLKEGGVDRLCTAVAVVCALVALLSVDASSAGLFSRPILALVDALGGEYGLMATGYEAGIRITGIFGNPNALAGLLAFGIFLSLSLLQTVRTARGRLGAALLTMCSAFGFLLAFSMGGIAAFALALAAYLLLTDRERRLSLLVTLVEVGALVLLLAFTAMPFLGRTGVGGLWPVLAGPAGGLLLWALQSKFQPSGQSKAVSAGVAALIAAAIGYVFLGYHLTGGITLAPGQTLRRSVYPEGGAYQVTAQWDGAPVALTVESQNTQQAIMHTSTVLYQGPLDQAAFTVPEDSRVVYFDLTAPEGAELEKLTLSDGHKVPLGYKLFPAFVANRIQGLWANQNAIQRLEFFRDGLAIFAASPLIGSGLGCVEELVTQVQRFYYESQYVHNQYIQAMAEMGLLGLGAFLAVLGTAACALLRRRKEGDTSPLLAALGACLVMMALHAGVEAVWSFSFYQTVALALLAGISVSCDKPVKKLTESKVGLRSCQVGLCLAVLCAGLLMGGHLNAVKEYADIQAGIKPQYADTMGKLAARDRYNWAQYKLDLALNAAVVEGPYGQLAGDYAAQLRRLGDYAINTQLMASHYFPRGELETFFAVSREGLCQKASSNAAWQEQFSLYEAAYLSGVIEDPAWFAAQCLKTYDQLQALNEGRMGPVALSPANLAFLEQMRALAQ